MSDDERPLASALNRDAGRYTVTTDPVALNAAAFAARRSFEEFPYYAIRFGERALSFGFSDGAWLARLCELRDVDAQEQIRWLGGVLSARGMPQLLLEKHLEFIHEKFKRALLKRGASMLRKLRLGAIAEKHFTRIAREFDRRTGKAIPRFGEILVAAVADEALGITNAVPSVEGWATDSQRFDKEWIDAVRGAITAARAVATSAS